MNLSSQRVALYALRIAETLSPEERAQLLDDAAPMLPRDQGVAAKDTSRAIRRSIRMQQDFFSSLKVPSVEEGA